MKVTFHSQEERMVLSGQSKYRGGPQEPKRGQTQWLCRICFTNILCLCQQSSRGIVFTGHPSVHLSTQCPSVT